jgi:ribosome maturation factor RimP
MAERLDDLPITHRDCVEISGSLSALLDVTDPIAGSYTLEISSPGIDRPLVRPEDYDHFSGFEARVELTKPLDGRRRFRGRLMGTSEGMIRLFTEGGEIQLPIHSIAQAKLVLTNDLIAASQKKFSEPPSPLGGPCRSNSLTHEA